MRTRFRKSQNTAQETQNYKRYCQQRNYVVKLKRQSVRNYFKSNCTSGPSNKKFWPTIKPFLTNKGACSSRDITLYHEGELVTNQTKVCEVFNQYFINIANSIGDPEAKAERSIAAIQENMKMKCATFRFRHISESKVKEKINNLNVKKATGHDQIPAKLLKPVSDLICKPLTSIINKTISTSIFPSSLKKAEIGPQYKKKDHLHSGNYRPLSILSSISKIFEGILSDQLIQFFNEIFSPFLSAYRKGYSCNTILLDLVETWRCSLDNGKYVGAVLMDLSKAFDCLPHEILLNKLEAYGLSSSAISLLQDYLSNRQQRVKLNSCHSSWSTMLKGVPQGSIMGPLLFNIFINDLFYTINECDLHNYADDNIISVTNQMLETVKIKLQNKATDASNWFAENQMLANIDKFQSIFLAPGRKQCDAQTLTINQTEIHSETSVNILGITVDAKLRFSTHVTNLCKKASKQLNVLRRLSKLLDEQSKMVIFKSFLLSNFNYCATVWHFCNKGDAAKLEKIQERALRFVFCDHESTYEDLLEKADSTTLHLSRIKQIAIEVFKIHNKLSPSYLNKHFDLQNSQLNTRGNNCNYKIHGHTTVTYGTQSFRHTGAKIWNTIPTHLKKAISLSQFKNLLITWSGTGCTCNFCKF